MALLQHSIVVKTQVKGSPLILDSRLKDMQCPVSSISRCTSGPINVITLKHGGFFFPRPRCRLIFFLIAERLGLLLSDSSPGTSVKELKRPQHSFNVSYFLLLLFLFCYVPCFFSVNLWGKKSQLGKKKGNTKSTTWLVWRGNEELRGNR